jgi:hypothetical protein
MGTPLAIARRHAAYNFRRSCIPTAPVSSEKSAGYTRRANQAFEAFWGAGKKGIFSYVSGTAPSNKSAVWDLPDKAELGDKTSNIEYQRD